MTQDDLKQIGKVIKSHVRPLTQRIETMEVKMERRFDAQDAKLDQLRTDVTTTVERVLATIDELHAEDDKRLRRIEDHLHLKRPA